MLNFQDIKSLKNSIYNKKKLNNKIRLEKVKKNEELKLNDSKLVNILEIQSEILRDVKFD